MFYKYLDFNPRFRDSLADGLRNATLQLQRDSVTLDLPAV